MKLAIAIGVLGFVLAQAQMEMNPGLKVRVTTHLLDAMTKARKAYIEESMEHLKENFKLKMKKIMKMAKKMGGGKLNKYQLQDSELTAFEDGSGMTMAFKEPNIVSMSWNDMKMEMKFTVKAKGKVGTVTTKVGLEKAELSLGIEKTDKGNFKLTKESCGLTFGNIEAKFEGWGEEKDTKMNEKVAKKIEDGKSMIQTMLCPWMDSGLLYLNVLLDSKNCRHEVPMFKNLYVAKCLIKNPEATADYLEMSFCGQTTYGNESGKHTGDYNPQPMEMSDDGKTKMIYIYQAEAMANYFLMQAYKHGMIKLTITKDSHPDLAAALHAKVNKVRALKGVPELSEGAEVTTSFVAVDEQPTLTFADGVLKATAKFEVQHSYGNCDVCEPKEVKYKMKVAWTYEPEMIDQEDKVFPRMGGKITVDSIDFEGVPEELLAKANPKEGFEKLANIMLQKLADLRAEQEDQIFPVKLFQIKNSQLLAKSGTSELNGDVVVNVKKIADLSAQMYGKDSSSSEEDEEEAGDDVE